MHLDFHSRKPINALKNPNRPSEDRCYFLLRGFWTTGLTNALLRGHVPNFQAGNYPKDGSETFNWFLFGPTWSLTMIEQRGDREYRRDQPTFHGDDRQQLRSAPQAETRAAF
jgi:hypothetical protein